jgi:hypothetical protein
MSERDETDERGEECHGRQPKRKYRRADESRRTRRRREESSRPAEWTKLGEESKTTLR